MRTVQNNVDYSEQELLLENAHVLRPSARHHQGKIVVGLSDITIEVSDLTI
jgi:hypothetical protein